MLQIIINQTPLDLPSDISVEISIEHPLCISDRLPVAFSLSFEIPATPANNLILEQPERITSQADFTRKIPGEIRFASFTIITGAFIIEQASVDNITLQFTGATLPDNIRRHLQNHDIGTYFHGGPLEQITQPSGIPSVECEKLTDELAVKLWYETHLRIPNVIAAPLAIKSAPYTAVEFNLADPFTNRRAMFCNYYVDGYKHVYHRDQGVCGYLTKVLPAFRVGFLLEKIIGSHLKSDNIFNTDLERLMLVSTFSSYYDSTTNSPVWKWDQQTHNVSMVLSDYLPDMAANDFLSELLKIPCASLYPQGDTFTIELNDNTLDNVAILDWTDKMVGIPTISRQAGQQYSLAYGGNAAAEPVSPDGPYYRSTTINNILYDPILNAAPDTETSVYVESAVMGQVFRQTVNTHLSEIDDNGAGPRHVNYELLSTNIDGTNTDQDPEDEREAFNMSINAAVVTPTIATEVMADDANIPLFDSKGCSMRRYIYCPQIEQPTSERPNTLMFGLWGGMQNVKTISQTADKLQYPYISHVPFTPDGTRFCDVSLAPVDLIEKYHKKYQQWIEKDKQIIRTDILLSPSDLEALNLREKIHLAGKDFFIKTINITLRKEHIEPSDIEFIEA